MREDRLSGRVYLPSKDLERFGCTLDLDARGRFTDPPDALAALVRHEAARARDWYEEGARLVRLLDRRSAACTMAMAGDLPVPAGPDRRRPAPGAGRAVVAAHLAQDGHRGPRGGRTPPMSGSPVAPVAIVGGGLAGIAAAVALGEAGHAVTLYEARPRLGGATHSFERHGMAVDNGQHVFLRCCTAYMGLLDRMGVSDKVRLQKRFDVRVLTPEGRGGRLRRTALPGPLHMLPALATYSLLGPADRLRAVRGALALARLDPADPALDRITLQRWLASHGQPEPVREALWDLLAKAALNVGAEQAALGPAVKVFRTALLGRSDAADIGVPDAPLGELHGTAAHDAIKRRGGEVRLSAKVTGIAEGPAVVVDGALVPSGRGDRGRAARAGRQDRARRGGARPGRLA
ncbi:FAD-dependent oxidoreductase [Nonomuraea ferruginea]